MRVFFDLITIRFLFTLHVAARCIFSAALDWANFWRRNRRVVFAGVKKLCTTPPSCDGTTGRFVIFGAVLILAASRLLAMGLLGEMQVRHYHEQSSQGPYSVDRVLRTQSQQAIPE